MNRQYLWAVFVRFLRAFTAGGFAQICITLATNPFSLTTWEDLRKWAVILIVAFISGGAMALDKLLRYDTSKV